ncbi:hypothetical protein MauCBS54593_003294 [Microsporum audouinii]
MSGISDQLSLRNSHSILAEPLPDLLTQEGYRTSSSAWHSEHYLGRIRLWDLKKEVRRWTASKYLKRDTLSADLDSLSEQPGYIHKEHYLCGDEQSVCGRFAQNALGPVSAVAFHHGHHYRFGDYKVCLESQKPGNERYVPDHVAVKCSAANTEELRTLSGDFKPEMVLVGEAKTPWKHRLGRYIESFEEKHDTQLRQALGQIASYMHRFQMRYGFLTTYDETIFIQQFIQQYPNGKEESELYISRAIKATSSGNDGDVSVRQCLYYLLAVISNTGEYTIENSFQYSEWVGPKAAVGEADISTMTPLAHRIRAPSPVLQLTPRGKESIPNTGPLLMKYDSGFMLTLYFKKEHVREDILGNGFYVEICGQKLSVTIYNGDDRGAGGGSGSSPPHDRPQGDKKRSNVTFGGSLFHPAGQGEGSTQRSERSDPYQRRDMEGHGKRKGKAGQNPEYSNPQYSNPPRSDFTESGHGDAYPYGEDFTESGHGGAYPYGEDFTEPGHGGAYPYGEGFTESGHGGAYPYGEGFTESGHGGAYPYGGGFSAQDAYLQSPTPAPRPERSNAYPLSSSSRPGQQASMELPLRPRDEVRSSRSESSRGEKSKSSKNTTKKSSRKK